MPIIYLETIIKADIEVCFDLSRSIELHKISTEKTNEKAISGVTTGLINLNEYVTWQATHFGVRQKLTSKITQFKRPFHFRDEQLQGAFKYMIHDHIFEIRNDVMVMTDRFEFVSPFGFIGRLFDKFVLKAYMIDLLVKRNEMIKEFAESEKWESLIVKK